MNFVAEWVTMSAPHFSGWHRYGDASVLSITSGMPLSCATPLMPSRSRMSPFGFPIVSP